MKLTRLYLVAYVLFATTSFATSQADLLSTQQNYQNARNNYQDAKTSFQEAKKELADAKTDLVQAQNNLKTKQANFILAQKQVESTTITYTKATQSINKVWGGNPDSGFSNK